ncbi:MAG: oxidoreductase FAD/NAD(P)-binding domain protein [Pseudonocardiales bacterium]|nr:oxidoreductase FAD/NAD(P)-binding domain protein [Pseudonocardiales bacterium]
MVSVTAPTRATHARAGVDPPVRVAPELALAAIAVGLVAVTFLWWHDTFAVNGLGEWLTNAGRLTGLWAGYTIVVLLALMARVPALDRGVGADRLARWHAMGGRYAVCLSVAHTLLIIWGYAVTAHTNVIHQTSTLITSYPDVLMATVGLGLLVAVGVSSARAARRKLQYETWLFLHLYTYLAIALIFSHQFSTGADFSSNAPARWLWSAMYIVVATLLVWYRLLVPVYRAVKYPMRVAGLTRENGDTVSVYLAGPLIARLRAESGQFFRWRFLTRDLWWAANPYSLSAAPRPDLLRITVKTAGEHSRALLTLAPGTRVFAEGPYGGMTKDRRRRRKVLLIAGGVGITPLRALFESLPGRPGDLTLLYRARTEHDLVLRAEIEAIAQHRGSHVHYLTGPSRPDQHDHLSAQRLSRLVPDLRQHDVYVCGPEAMMASARRALIKAGVPRRHIHHESFSF